MNTSFRYIAVTPNGLKEKGTIVAVSKSEVEQRLDSENKIPIKISKVRTAASILPKSKLSRVQLIELCEQLYMLLSSGLSLLSALIIAKNEHQDCSYQEPIEIIIQQIHKGESLTKAFELFPESFDTFFCGLIEMGEQTGKLDVSFLYIKQHFTLVNDINQKVKSAMIYPSAIIIVGIVVISLMLLKVVPSFQTIFASVDKTLPYPTVLVIKISQFVQSNFYWLLAIPVFLYLVYVFTKSFKYGKFIIDKLLLNLPLVGAVLTFSLVARLSQSLYVLTKAGIPLHQSLLQVEKQTSNSVYQKAISELRTNVEKGTTMSSSLRDNPLFPNLFIQMIIIGEESGKMEQCFAQLGKLYQQKLSVLVNNLVKLIEPSIMIVLGVIIGGLILAMYLPIFDMSSII